MRKRLLIVVNVDWFFLSHRLPVALAAKARGYEVHVAVEITEYFSVLQGHGFVLHPLAMERKPGNVLKELRELLELLALFRKVKPDIVHLVTIRPVLYGGIAARFFSVPGVVAAISGLGHTFVAPGFKARLRRQAVGLLYRIALKSKRVRVIFQNEEDATCLRHLAGLDPGQCELIPGSGVDLDTYAPVPLPQGDPVILMASRLLVEKGVWDFIEAVSIVRQRFPQCRAILAGDIDPANPSSLTRADLERIQEEGIVELFGQCHDMPALIAESHVVVLPSYYGEGVPKVLIEAAASGRPIVTTDMPGCRDTIWPGRSGLLVPPRNSDALAKAIVELIGDRRRCELMGAAGRELACQLFDIQHVITKHMGIYAKLFGNPPLFKRSEK